MPEPEEGAAYFDAFADVMPPRTMGLHEGMLTRGFVPIPGYGGIGDESEAPTEKEYWSTYGMFAAAALITFFLSKGTLK